MVFFALSHIGDPYVWRAKGNCCWSAAGPVPLPDGYGTCWDCSGLVLGAFRFADGRDWTQTHSANTLFHGLPPVDMPRLGTLALYGRHGTAGGADTATHVMVHVAAGIVVGSSGGLETTDSPAAARKRFLETGIKCEVTTFADVLYRKDFLGYRELPFGE